MVICWSFTTNQSPINGCPVDGWYGDVCLDRTPRSMVCHCLSTQKQTIDNRSVDRTPLGVHSPFAHPPITHSCGLLPQPTTQPFTLASYTQHHGYALIPLFSNLNCNHVGSAESINTTMSHTPFPSLHRPYVLVKILHYHLTLKATTQSTDHTICMFTPIILCYNHLCTLPSSRAAGGNTILHTHCCSWHCVSHKDCTSPLHPQSNTLTPTTNPNILPSTIQ